MKTWLTRKREKWRLKLLYWVVGDRGAIVNCDFVPGPDDGYGVRVFLPEGSWILSNTFHPDGVHVLMDVQTKKWL